jgi:soluble epoxide hydrolase/lipid-phosphate phosphatase
MEAWSKAGYPVVVPHMLGYGRTAKPLEAEAYSAKNICSQLAAVMDHLQLEKVVVLGHDWGAAIAWRFALWFPERLIGLVV